MTRAIVGVIGGSGVYDLPGLTDLQGGECRPRGASRRTPCVSAASATPGRIPRPTRARAPFLAVDDQLPRQHRALKRAGVTDIIALSACGSYNRDLYPGCSCWSISSRTGHICAVDFFGMGCVAHVSMAHPVAPQLSRRRRRGGAEGIPFKEGGTYVCMEGPQFSSLAECSATSRAVGRDRHDRRDRGEAGPRGEIPYASVAMVTDFDCWHEEHGAVDVARGIKVMHDNADKAARLVARALSDFPAEHEPCPIGSDRALEFALITHADARDPDLVEKLDAVAGRVLGRG